MMGVLTNSIYTREDFIAMSFTRKNLRENYVPFGISTDYIQQVAFHRFVRPTDAPKGMSYRASKNVPIVIHQPLIGSNLGLIWITVFPWTKYFSWTAMSLFFL